MTLPECFYRIDKRPGHLEDPRCSLSCNGSCPRILEVELCPEGWV